MDPHINWLVTCKTTEQLVNGNATNIEIQKDNNTTSYRHIDELDQNDLNTKQRLVFELVKDKRTSIYNASDRWF